MSEKINNAKNLYLKGIAQGRLEAVDEYTGKRYTQHSTGVRDGVEGFKAFFQDFIDRTSSREIKVVRAIADHEFVFLHVYQDIDHGKARWITTDMFETDQEDKMIEHWDVISPHIAASETASGNEVVIGDFQIEDIEKSEENKSVVRNFLVNVFQNGFDEDFEKYVDKNLIQHSPSISNGVDALKETRIQRKITYDFIFKVIGQGNYVVSYSKVLIGKEEYAVFDIFRLKNGKIIEHWDNMEPIPPRSTWANTGKF